MEKARQVATTLGKAHFKGTNGWLDKWKTRYGIKRFSVCGESGDVQIVTIESWKEKLPELLEGYEKEDIVNLDETGCFLESPPKSWAWLKRDDLKGRKKSKHRITIMFPC